MIDHFSKYKKLADKHKLPFDVVQHICESQFEFTRNIISSDEDVPVRLQFLGKFHVPKNKRANLKKKSEFLKNLRKRNDKAETGQTE